MSASSHKRKFSGAPEVQNRVYGKPPLNVHIPNSTRKTLGKFGNQVHEQAAAANSATAAEEAGPPWYVVTVSLPPFVAGIFFRGFNGIRPPLDSPQAKSDHHKKNNLTKIIQLLNGWRRGAGNGRRSAGKRI